MKRLVYTPRVDAFIQTDTGLYDVSPYITKGSVTRRQNAVSTVNLTLRNPQFMWTDGERTDSDGSKVLAPVFHPMDKITVTLTRIKDRPMQVFTGFLDTTPYISAYPGVVELTASCTLKRLLYTYFDPGLPFVHTWLEEKGWQTNTQTGLTQLGGEKSVEDESLRLNDASIGKLLFDVLNEIGGWDPESIFIEGLPEGIISLVAAMVTDRETTSEEAFKDIKLLLKEMIGTATLSGYAVNEDGGSVTSGVGKGEWVKVGATTDDYSGGDVSCGNEAKNNGFSYAELGVAGTNKKLKLARNGGFLADLFDIKGEVTDGTPTGLKCRFKLEIRDPKKPSKTWFITKVDNGSGQAGDAHYKIDLEPGITKALKFSGKGDVEIRRAD